MTHLADGAIAAYGGFLATPRRHVGSVLARSRGVRNSAGVLSRAARVQHQIFGDESRLGER